MLDLWCRGAYLGFGEFFVFHGSAAISVPPRDIYTRLFDRYLTDILDFQWFHDFIIYKKSITDYIDILFIYCVTQQETSENHQSCLISLCSVLFVYCILVFSSLPVTCQKDWWLWIPAPFVPFLCCLVLILLICWFVDASFGLQKLSFFEFHKSWRVKHVYMLDPMYMHFFGRARLVAIFWLQACLNPWAIALKVSNWKDVISENQNISESHRVSVLCRLSMHRCWSLFVLLALECEPSHKIHTSIYFGLGNAGSWESCQIARGRTLLFWLVELWHPSKSNQFSPNVSIGLHVYPVVFDMSDMTWCGLMLDSLQTKYTKGFQSAWAHDWSFWRHFSRSQSPCSEIPRSAGRKISKICWQSLEWRPGREARTIQMDARQGLTAEVIECLRSPKKYLVLLMRAEAAPSCRNLTKVHLMNKTWTTNEPMNHSQWEFSNQIKTTFTLINTNHQWASPRWSGVKMCEDAWTTLNVSEYNLTMKAAKCGVSNMWGTKISFWFRGCPILALANICNHSVFIHSIFVQDRNAKDLAFSQSGKLCVVRLVWLSVSKIHYISPWRSKFESCAPLRWTPWSRHSIIARDFQGCLSEIGTKGRQNQYQ